MCAHAPSRDENHFERGSPARADTAARTTRDEKPDFTERPYGRCGPLDPELLEVATITRWRLAWSENASGAPGRRSEDLHDLE